MSNLGIAAPQIELPQSTSYRTTNSFTSSKEGRITYSPQLTERAFEISPRPGVIPLPAIESNVNLKVQCIDKNGAELFSTGLIQMQRIRKGKQITELRKTLRNVPVRVSIVSNHSTGKQRFSIAYTGNSSNVIARDMYNKVLRAFMDASLIRITDGQLKADIPNELKHINPSLQEQYTDRMVHALAVIVQKTDVKLRLPAKFTANEVLYAEEIAKILDTGVASQRLDMPENSVLIANVHLEDAIGFMELQDKGILFSIKTPGPEQDAEILGRKIPLGGTLYEFQNVSLHNYDELKAAVSQGVADSTIVRIVFDIDLEHVLTLFKKWAQPEQLETNWLDAPSEDSDTDIHSNLPGGEAQCRLPDEAIDVPADVADQTAYRNAVRAMRAKLYQQAREYWSQLGDQDRLALTDEQLDEQFWLIDHQGIPRLKTDQGTISVPPDPLEALVGLIEDAPPDLSSSVRETMQAHYQAKADNGSPA